MSTSCKTIDKEFELCIQARCKPYHHLRTPSIPPKKGSNASPSHAFALKALFQETRGTMLSYTQHDRIVHGTFSFTVASLYLRRYK